MGDIRARAIPRLIKALKLDQKACTDANKAVPVENRPSFAWREVSYYQY